MSARLTGAVFYLNLPSHLKLVLSALADHADDDGSSCYPSVGLLTVKTSGSERKVRRDISDLERRGYLSRGINAAPDERIPLDRRPNDYLLDAERICREAARRRQEVKNGRPPVSTRGRPPMTARAATSSINGRPPVSTKKDLDLKQPPEEAPARQHNGEWETADLGSILALMEQCEAPNDLFDVAFWEKIRTLTEGTQVFYDDQLRAYLAWLETRPPERRHRNHRRGFMTWIKTEIGRDGRRTNARAR